VNNPIEETEEIHLNSLAIVRMSRGYKARS